jgi:hypothetical protein
MRAGVKSHIYSNKDYRVNQEHLELVHSNRFLYYYDIHLFYIKKE